MLNIPGWLTLAHCPHHASAMHGCRNTGLLQPVGTSVPMVSAYPTTSWEPMWSPMPVSWEPLVAEVQRVAAYRRLYGHGVRGYAKREQIASQPSENIVHDVAR